MVLKGNDPTPVVIFFTDNGIGLGHLTRQSAVALRARGAFTPMFLTMSAGYPLPQRLGIPTEYFPAYGRFGIPKGAWEQLAVDRLAEAVRQTGAVAVIVDHVSPPAIFEALRARTPGVKYIWSRRGLWQPGRNADVVRAGGDFDLIVEPGDLAAPIDQGPTADRRGEVVPISPVVLVDPDDQVPRGDARKALGIPNSGPAVLLNLGGRDLSEVENLLARTRSVVNRLSKERTHLFAPLHPLHGHQVPQVQGVTMAPVYPVARYLKAFDAAISMAGYNSFHEISASGLPAVFLPHLGAKIDDQRRRAEFAALSGRAQWAPNVFDPSFLDAVARILRPAERHTAAKVAGSFGPMRGAVEFAAIIAEVAGTVNSVDKPSRLARMSTGKGVAPPLRDNLLIALEYDDEELSELADSLDPGEVETTVVLVRKGNAHPLYRRGFLFESVMNEAEWSTLGKLDYAGYLEDRIMGITARYTTTRSSTHPGTVMRRTHT